MFYLNRCLEGKPVSYERKSPHGYILNMEEEDKNIGNISSFSSMPDIYVTSYLERHAITVREEEIATKYLIKRRDKIKPSLLR